MRTLARLSQATIRHAKEPGYLADGGNLYLQVTLGANGQIRKSWAFRFELDGKRYEAGLGPLHTRGLAEARDKAREWRQQLLDGINPLAARREAKKQRFAALAAEAKALTFEQAAKQYIASHERGWKNAKHRQQWKNTLSTYAYPVLGKLAVDDVTTAHVVRVLEPIWQAKPETASRLRGRIEKVLGWAAVRGYRSGDNPARWRGHLQEMFPAKGKVRKAEHHPALPYEEIGGFMKELRSHSGVAPRALEFVILTAVRTGDIIGNDRDEKPPMKWRHVDVKKRLWIIPSTKTDTEHRVPLSDPAMKVLAEMEGSRSGEIVFPGANAKQPLSNMAMLAVIRRINAVRERRGLPRHLDPKQGNRDVTVHGFRSTFRDWAAERTAAPNHVVEMALAHAIEDEVEAAYRRGDLLEKRRRLMQQWSDYCARPAAVTTTNVVSMQGAARA
jgi:integrase